MTAEDRMERALKIVIFGAIVVVVLCFFAMASALAHDHDHPELDQWYAGLMQPDNPTASCCSKSDAYYADEVHVRDGKVYATITDDRPDGPLGRPHREVGETFEIPSYKMNRDPNPTGHRVIFLSPMGHVFCFVDGSGS